MYSTAEEVREMLKTDTLDALIGDAYIEDEREREAKIRPLILQAIQDADGEIDGYLAKRYTVPLPKPPGNIVKFSKDIAVYNLFSRIGIDEGTEPEELFKPVQCGDQIPDASGGGKSITWNRRRGRDPGSGTDRFCSGLQPQAVFAVKHERMVNSGKLQYSIGRGYPASQETDEPIFRSG